MIPSSTFCTYMGHPPLGIVPLGIVPRGIVPTVPIWLVQRCTYRMYWMVYACNAQPIQYILYVHGSSTLGNSTPWNSTHSTDLFCTTLYIQNVLDGLTTIAARSLSRIIMMIRFSQVGWMTKLNINMKKRYRQWRHHAK